MVRQHCDQTEVELSNQVSHSGVGRGAEVSEQELGDQSPVYRGFVAVAAPFNDSRMWDSLPPTRGRGKKRGQGTKRDRSPNRHYRRDFSPSSYPTGRPGTHSWRSAPSSNTTSSGASVSSVSSVVAGSHTCVCPHVIGHHQGKQLNLDVS